MRSRPRELMPSATMTTCRSEREVSRNAHSAPSEAHIGKESLLVLPALDDYPQALPRVNVSKHFRSETHGYEIEARFHPQ